jgi:hypothetical protein
LDLSMDWLMLLQGFLTIASCVCVCVCGILVV